jgi:drug/metabolite transporter (DMT)-like permease
VLGGSFEGVDPIGVFSALGAAVIYSCYIVIGNRLLRNIDPLVTTLYVCFTAGLTFLLYGVAAGEMDVWLPLQGWLAILGIALFSTLVGVLGFFTGLRLIGATSASILSTLEPLLTVFLSALLLGERVTSIQAVGGLVLLVGVLVLQMWGREEKVVECMENAAVG